MVKKDVYNFMVTDGPSGKIFAYARDITSSLLLYHDANDLPLALAPIWGFTPSDDEIWLNTMNFAFSNHNRLGYRAGPYGGLGSIHAGLTWTLGLLQEAIFHITIDNKNRAWNIIDKILSVATNDGLMPESIDPLSGFPYTRLWFCWPNALLVWIMLELLKK